MNTTATLKPNTVPRPVSLKARGRLIPLNAGPLIMGVLNVTPDSFSDGGRYLDPGAAVDHAAEMAAQGADLIDIGAESTRPGADPVDQEEERRRLIPVVRAVCRAVSVPVSVDTTKAAVARQPPDAGPALVNDIRALRYDSGMKPLTPETGAGTVLMHMQGTPKTMQQAPSYRDVIEEVRKVVVERIGTAGEPAVAGELMLLEPGISCGKSLQHDRT